MKPVNKIYFLLILLCFAISTSAQKTIYIPNTFNQNGADDYCNKYGKNGRINSIDNLTDETERWSKARSFETENIICFWEPGFGNDPTKLKNPASTSQTFNLKLYLAECEKIFNFHVNTLKATPANGIKINKYKFMFMLSYTTNWIAYGGGYDYTIGAMWLNPAAIGVGSGATYPYFVIAHELFHSMSYQAYSDRPGTTYRAFQDSPNGPFWERSANYAAAQMYPNVNNDFARYMFATQSHFLNTRKHYTTSFFLENLKEAKGISSIGSLWCNNTTNEHPMGTAKRMFFDNDQSKLNDFMGQTAMKNITWDYATGGNGLYYKSFVNGLSSNTDGTSNIDAFSMVMKKHRTILQAINVDKLHFAIRDCQAPQDYGYNAIQIFPKTANSDGSYTVKMRFKGHIEGDDTQKKSGWRWGFVAVEANGMPRYGTIHKETDGVIILRTQPSDKELWLVVTGAPAEHGSTHNYKWEAGLPKYHRYPYEVRFENALPMGYNEGFEGAKASGAAHINGGGWVASTARVAATAYVGPHAKVLGTAVISDTARIEDYAIVKGSSKVYGNARIRENAMVFSNAKVYGNAIVSGAARVFNNSEVYGNAFVTDNAFIDKTKIYGDAIACGNLWQRENTCEIGGTCVAGGDGEYMGFIATGDAVSGPEIMGTFLQWPENANNSRARKDKKGNLTVVQLSTLKNNWNNLQTRFDILNKSISTLSSNPNYDINKPYNYFNTDSVMSLDNAVADTLLSGYELNKLPDGYYLIKNSLDNTVLTFDGTSTPKFKPLSQSNDTLARQTWSLSLDTTKRYKIMNAFDKTKYLNHLGQVLSTSYLSTTHTYNIYHNKDNDCDAIQRAGSYFWTIKSGIITGNGSMTILGQPFKLEATVLTGVNAPLSKMCRISPNPVVNQMNLSLPENISSGKLLIYSLNGVLKGNWVVNGGNNTIDLSGLSSGIYFGKIQSEDLRETIRIIKTTN